MNILKYTKDLIDELENKDITLTEIYIAYKVILILENNEIELDFMKLKDIVEDIYNRYLKSEDIDSFDILISEYIDEMAGKWFPAFSLYIK